MSTHYLTAGEAAAILRVTPRTLYEWLRSKQLSGKKFGKGSKAVWRIPVEAVVAKKDGR